MIRKSLKITIFNLTLAGALFSQAEVISITSPTSGAIIDTNFVRVSFDVATYFSVGDSGCTDCDGYLKSYLNEIHFENTYGYSDLALLDLVDGYYFLKMEAVDPNGYSFDPVIEDTVSFTIIGNPTLCRPYDLMVYSGEERNTIEWSEPSLGGQGGIGCGDYVISSLPFSEINTNVGMGDDWDVTFSDGEDVAYTLNVSSTITIDVTMCNSGTNYDTKLEIFTFEGTDCSLTYTDAVSTGNYNDDYTCAFSGLYSSLIGVTLDPGQYYIIADGYGGNTGTYEISVVESTVGRSVAQDSMNDYDLELLKSGLTPSDLFADFQMLQDLRSTSREVDILCGTFVGYNVYNLADNALVGTSDTTFFIHENLTNDIEYCYYVRAEYSEGESANSDTACGTPEAFTALPVTNLNATELDEEVDLSWTDPNTSTFVYYTSFEGFDGGFTASGDWERGLPADGPGTASSGSECFGTVLNGAYNNNSSSFLTSPAYSLDGIANPMLQISHWYNIESYYDGGNVKISTDNGSTWSLLQPTVSYPEDAVYSGNSCIPSEEAYSGTNSGNMWHTAQFDLSSYDSSVTVMFRFDFGSDASVTYEGWFIDDFAIFSNLGGGREVDGDLTHYNVYQDGSLIADSVETTGYMVTGLTNATSYEFSVSASYYPDYESDTVNVSATPTWLFGDIVGTVTDPNGNPLDSAVVSSGEITDTTGADGQYALMDLEPGSNLFQVKRDRFETAEAYVTVVAQEDADTANFSLIPKISPPGELIATGGDTTVNLIWTKPGSSSAGNLTGTWMLYFDWSCTGSPGSVEVEFTDSGELLIYGDVLGNWYGVSETVDLMGTYSCDAVAFDYNAYFTFTYYSTIYYMEVDGDEFSGVITSGYGDHDGDNSGVRLTGNARTMSTMSDISELFMSEEMANDPIWKQRSAERLALQQNEQWVQFQDLTPQFRSVSDSLIGYNVYQVTDNGDSLVATNNDPDDTTASIIVPSNYVEYCFNVTARWSTDNYGVLESYATEDVCATAFKPGDIDFDDAVDVSDLLSVVNFILETDIPTETEYRNADVNSDDELNIADVVMIVDIILGRSSDRLALIDDDVLVNLSSTEEQLLLSMDYEGLTRGVQFTLDASMSVEFGSPLLSVSDAGTMVMSNRSEDGKLSVVVVNTQGSAVERHEDVLVRIPYSFTGERNDKASVVLHEVKAAGMAGESLPVTVGEKRIDISIVPAVFALHQNYPNPFNPVTEIQFDVPSESHVTLTIYNIMGQEVRTLSNSTLEAGFHSIRWDGTNESGELISTGVYFYRLTSPSFTSTKKMLMVK